MIWVGSLKTPSVNFNQNKITKEVNLKGVEFNSSELDEVVFNSKQIAASCMKLSSL